MPSVVEWSAVAVATTTIVVTVTFAWPAAARFSAGHARLAERAVRRASARVRVPDDPTKPSGVLDPSMMAVVAAWMACGMTAVLAGMGELTRHGIIEPAVLPYPEWSTALPAVLTFFALALLLMHPVSNQRLAVVVRTPWWTRRIRVSAWAVRRLRAVRHGAGATAPLVTGLAVAAYAFPALSGFSAVLALAVLILLIVHFGIDPGVGRRPPTDRSRLISVDDAFRSRMQFLQRGMLALVAVVALATRVLA